MAEMNDRTTRSHEADADDMSLLLHHLLSSSSTPNPISPDKGKVPFHLPPPSQTSDAALAIAARRAVGLNSGWDIFCHVKNPFADDDRTRPPQPHLPDRDRTTSTEESSAAPLVRPYSAGEMKDGRRSNFVGSSDYCDAASGKRRKAASSSVEADFDEYECESEEGVEVSEEPSRAAPARSASKRSRAAEVHNLSEKRRRSRINEKMKALQNLIPNSNKTDKASMLDEAIEYLKQLQLQVQMLSMRNGLSLHPMYLPASLQPIEIPQMSMGFGAGNGSLHMNMGMSMLSMKEDPTTQASFGLSNQSIPSTQTQPPLMPGLTNMNTNSETFSDLSQGHHGSFHLSAASGETYREDVLPQEVDVNHSLKMGKHNSRELQLFGNLHVQRKERSNTSALSLVFSQY
ncbi:hypothetical protein AAC387_Pa03g3667 [Persea americana]